MTNSHGQARMHVFIAGRVQGVGFRYHTRLEANALGLTGWVRNHWDGRVEAVFEGSPAAVQRAVAWCHHGAPAAYVEHVEVREEPATGEFRTFVIVS